MARWLHSAVLRLFSAYDEVLDLIMAKTGAKDRAAIKSMLKTQRAGVLQKVKEAKVEMKRKKSAEEAARLERVMQHVRRLGLCVMGFEVSSVVFAVYNI